LRDAVAFGTQGKLQWKLAGGQQRWNSSHSAAR